MLLGIGINMHNKDEKIKKIIYSKEMREVMNSHPVVDKRLYVGYFLFIFIALVFLYFSITIFSHGIKYKIHGEEIVATVKAVNEDERLISIKYTYNGEDYQNILKYWDANLDIGSSVNILVLKDNPNDISSTSNYILLSVFLLALSIVLITSGLIAYFKAKKEETRVFLLIKYGIKKIGTVLAIEDKYVSSEFKHKYIISAMCDDVVYDSKKLSFAFNPEGMSGYLVDIYFNEKDKNNYFLDYTSIRSKYDEERKKNQDGE